MEWYIVLIIVICSILLLLYLIVLFMSLPGSNRKVIKYDWLFEKPIAHRGYHNNNEIVPENSKKAFERAIEKGYNIEIDLNLTKDNRIVVFHDGDVNRMCNVNKKVHDLTLDELQALPLKIGQEHMMELKEFLDFVDGRVGILIEYKGEGKQIDQTLCEESMKILKNYQGKWVMQSFQPSILKWFRVNYPMIPRGQLCLAYTKIKKGEDSTSYIKKWLFTNNLSNFIGRPTFMSRKCTDINLMTKLVCLNCKLLIWTVNDLNLYKKYHKKADNIIFEYLDLNLDGQLKQ